MSHFSKFGTQHWYKKPKDIEMEHLSIVYFLVAFDAASNFQFWYQYILILMQ